MKTLKKTPLVLLFATLAFASAPAAVLYNLDTAVVSGTGQNTFAASTTAGVSGTGTFSGALPTNLTFTSGNTGFDYFVGKFTLSTLTTVGDTITLSFTASGTNFNSTTGQSIRFGLFNIGAATNGASPTYGAAGSRGYRADYGLNNNPGAGSIRELTADAANLFATGASPALTANSVPFTFDPNGTYSGSFTLELLAGNQVQITSQIGGTTAVSVTDVTSAFTSFNSFGIFLTGNGSPASLNFSSLTVASVPEPGSAALLFLGVGMVGLLRRRKAVR